MVWMCAYLIYYILLLLFVANYGISTGKQVRDAMRTERIWERTFFPLSQQIEFTFIVCVVYTSHHTVFWSFYSELLVVVIVFVAAVSFRYVLFAKDIFYSYTLNHGQSFRNFYVYIMLSIHIYFLFVSQKRTIRFDSYLFCTPAAHSTIWCLFRRNCPISNRIRV